MTQIPAILRCVFVLLVFPSTLCFAQPAPSYGVVSYTSNGKTFDGYLFKPDGDGPFPAVIFNHGHTKHLIDAGRANEYFSLARVFVNDGFVFFIPDRHMRYVQTNEFSTELRDMIRDKVAKEIIDERKYREVSMINADDVAASVKWLKQQSYVDSKRVVLSGWSGGALAALNATSTAQDVSALVLFCPAVTQWHEPEAKKMLRTSLEKFRQPVFLIQASNDKTTEPARVAERILKERETPYRVMTYLYTQRSDIQNDSIAILGWELWGYDVMTFLESVLKPKAKASAQ